MLKRVPETVLESVEPEAASVNSANHGDRWSIGATPDLDHLNLWAKGCWWNHSSPL
jgi:hypothetical protein